MRAQCGRWILFLSAMMTPCVGVAHVTTTGLAHVDVTQNEIRYELNLTLPELPPPTRQVLSKAANGDTEAAEAVAGRMRKSIVVELGDVLCRTGRVRIQGAADGARVRLTMELSCEKSQGTLRLREDWEAYFGDHYATLASIRTSQGNMEVMLGEETREITVDIGRPIATKWFDFIWLGIEHILTGFDHLLFLVALLATARNLSSVIKIVTAFTVAHSITLSLATLGIMSIPSRIIEPLIAGSIVWVAVANLVSSNPDDRRWVISFAFGLVHGFGFASALEELQLSAVALARALVGFNVGVEIGQLIFIAALFPLLNWLMRTPRLATAPSIISLIVAVFGAYWCIDRLLHA